jgi:hypothetical protein
MLAILQISFTFRDADSRDTVFAYAPRSEYEEWHCTRCA